MQRNLPYGICALLAAAICTMPPANAEAQDNQKEQHKHQHEGQEHQQYGHDDPEMAAMMAAWWKHAQIGEHHHHLKAFVGRWTWVGKFWMAADAPPMESTGETETEPLLGGRFNQIKVRGSSPGSPVPFEGMEIMGYDNGIKRYTSVWIDSMSTSLAISEGTCDPSGRIFTMSGNHFDPSTGKEKKVRSVTTLFNNDKYMIEMFEVDDQGREFKTMEIICTRA